MVVSNYEWIIRKRSKLNQSLVRGRVFNVRGITNDYIFPLGSLLK